VIRKISALLVAVILTMTGIAVHLEAKGLVSPVQTAQGKLQGSLALDGKVVAYKGVPYAAPPVGNLRWQPPQPVKSWDGVKKADTFGASCLQGKNSRLPWTKEFMVQNEVSEDCLYLNVWTPAKKSDAPLPVFVYIHGGGFGEGSGAIESYQGANLAEMGVVVVTINYRLGIPGFLASPELTAESPHHASGNYGLLDQVAALQWIKDNIKSFNGNPGNVTICGQSAGAASVHYLTASPLAKGLFQRAIAESGSSLTGFPMRSLAEAEKKGAEFLASKHATTLAEARALPASDLLYEGAPGAGPSATDIDGWFLPQDVTGTFATGRQNDVPFMTGNTSEDAAPLFGPHITADKYTEFAQQRYKDLAPRYLGLYPAKTDDEVLQAQIKAGQDRGRVSTYLFVLRRNETSKTPAYTYYFDRATPWPEHPEFGAFHTSDIPYMMRNLKLVDHPYEAADYKVSDTMSQYWINFMKKGDPNGQDLEKWDAVSKEKKQVQEIGVRTGPIPLADPDKLNFWMDYFASPVSKNAPMF